MIQCFSEDLCISVSAPLNHMDLVEVHTAAELLRLRHMILGEVRQHLKIIFLSYLNGNFPVTLHKPCQFMHCYILNQFIKNRISQFVINSLINSPSSKKCGILWPTQHVLNRKEWRQWWNDLHSAVNMQTWIVVINHLKRL